MGDHIISRFEYFREQGDEITSDSLFYEWCFDEDVDPEDGEYEFMYLNRLILTHPEWKSEISHMGYTGP